MKKISKILLTLVIIFFVVKPALAQERRVNVYFFWGDGCPHCAAEKPFLDSLERKYPTIKIYSYEIWNNSKNNRYLIEVGKKLNTNVSGVPFTVVGNKAFIGFSETITPDQIESRVEFCLSNSCPDLVAEVVGLSQTRENVTPSTIPYTEDTNTEKKDESKSEKKAVIPEKISLPLTGDIQITNFSLPVLTIVLGALDGFNPCAIWTLLFLISLLLGMKDRKRRWILGTAFIVFSALVYFLFMAAWLNLLLFIGFIFWVRILIGLVAFGGGSYNLKEFFTDKNSGCKVTGYKKRQVVFEKLKKITQQRRFLLALGGIILLAFAVNLVELICSAGLPVIFTQILALSHLPLWQYYAYMTLYIFIFMLDDLFIFFTTMITLEMTGISTKYGRISRLIGGILMFIIGLLIVFKPEFLMFS